MKTYQITLPDEFAAFVDRMIAEGKWESADYVAMAALARLMTEMDHDDTADQEWLKKEIQKGIDSANRGDVAQLNMAAIWARVEQRLVEEKQGAAHAASDADGPR